MLKYSFKDVLAKAALTRAVVPVGAAPGKQRKQMQNKNLKKNPSLAIMPRRGNTRL